MKLNSILFCLLFAITANSFIAAKAQVNVKDSLALVDLYNSTNGPNWNHHTNWLTTAPVSTWFGVKVMDNYVVRIILGSNKLIGALPASIGNFTNLTKLDLNNNQLSGAIPATIGNLTKLDTLYLFTNKLSGAIPAEIGNLSSLTYLDFFRNKLSGAIPAEIGNLTNLTYLSLGYNKLTGAIPSAIGNLSNLTNLSLYENLLTGTIPSFIGNLTNLTDLNLDGNLFAGTIPAEIGNLVKLISLSARANQLSGAIPAAIGNLKKLNYLYLSNNQLSGSIPDFLSGLKKLKELQLGLNQLSGAVPSTLSNLTNLTYLSLSNNQLSGAIPASLNKIKNLSSDFSYNNFTQFSGFNALKDTNYHTETFVNRNLFTFDQLEPAIKYFYAYYYYAPQDTILPVHQNGNVLSVSAGGTLGKNTYNWYKTGTAGSTTIKGDSTFTPLANGKYYAKVTNAIVKQLTLYTDTISYTMASQSNASFLTNNTTGIKSADSKFLVYPNPAKDVVHIQTKGTATIILTNSAGKILLTKTINNSGEIKVSRYANGTYYLQNKTTGETQKIVVVH